MPTHDSPEAHLRPHFFIIGERKCGTSSLYRYLLEHPLVLPGPRKEMQFFTRGADAVEQGFDDYLRAFPRCHGAGEEILHWPELDIEGTLFEEPVRFQRREGLPYVTGEASADTMCEVEPALLKQYLPALKLIAILRDPVERAFSHHRMLARFQAEGRKLEFRVGDFVDDMRRELEAQNSGQRTLCLTPGIYVHSLRRWNQEWAEARPLVLFCERLENPQYQAAVMRRVLAHLQLPDVEYQPGLHKRYNQAPAATVPLAIAAELRAFYEPHNRELEAELGTSVPWPAIDGRLLAPS